MPNNQTIDSTLFDYTNIDHTPINSLVGVGTALTCITAVLVALRMWVRIVIVKKPGMDDYMSLTALIFTIGYISVLYVGKANGMGSPMGSLNVEEMETILKVFFAIELMYYVIVTCVKLSIVFLYDRFVTSGFGIIIDIWILILPLPILKRLQISTRTRHILYGVFGAGLVSSAFSCARLYSIVTFTKATDPFRDSTLLNVWSMVEVNIAIWCACVPALKPLFRSGPYDEDSTPNYHFVNVARESKTLNASRTLNDSSVKLHIIHKKSSSNLLSLRSPSGDLDDVELGLPRQGFLQEPALTNGYGVTRDSVAEIV
ncbi:hypothetical protein GGR52DRAFT_574902 [Hypoxylon sp. FL1284]|nr:hypothetical protein GGR52DRAFT_574902 [Hypoxylon sp. FL1284]